MPSAPKKIPSKAASNKDAKAAGSPPKKAAKKARSSSKKPEPRSTAKVVIGRRVLGF